MKHKKANVSLYISFIFISVVLVLLAAIVSPLGAKISTIFFTAGQNMLDSNGAFLEQINDDTIRDELNQTFISASASAQNNIDVLSAIYKYAWIIITLIVGLVLFLFSRMQVERTQQGYV